MISVIMMNTMGVYAGYSDSTSHHTYAGNLSINVLYYIYKIGVNVLHYYTFPGIVTYIDFYGGISVLQICIIVGVVLAGVILNSKVVKLF